MPVSYTHLIHRHAAERDDREQHERERDHERYARLFVSPFFRCRYGEVMIMARITIDGKQCQFSTKQSIQHDNWSIAAGKAKGLSLIHIWKESV